MLLLASSGPAASSVAIVLAASAGLLGAVVAFLKLGAEKNQSAVLQAQGAMETMVQLQEELEKALARQIARADLYKAQLDEVQSRYDAAVEHWGPFPNG
jgi:hypothetical protein